MSPRASSRLKGRRASSGDLIAGIDTGGDYLSVAVIQLGEGADALAQAEVIGAQHMRLGHRHAKRCLGVLEELLTAQDCAVTDLSLIGVGRGPGGFTGIRVGLATAIGLSLATPASVWPVDSLAVLAAGVQGFKGAVIALLDARRSEVYGAAYRVDGASQPERLFGPVVAGLDSALSQAEALIDDNEPVLIVGSGALAYGCQSAVSPDVHIPSAVQTARLAAAQWLAAGRDAGQAPPVDPVYVRPSDAELNAGR